MWSLKGVWKTTHRIWYFLYRLSFQPSESLQALRTRPKRLNLPNRAVTFTLPEQSLDSSVHTSELPYSFSNRHTALCTLKVQRCQNASHWPVRPITINHVTCAGCLLSVLCWGPVTQNHSVQCCLNARNNSSYVSIKLHQAAQRKHPWLHFVAIFQNRTHQGSVWRFDRDIFYTSTSSFN